MNEPSTYSFYYERDQDGDWGTDGHLEGSIIISYDFEFMVNTIQTLLNKDIKSFRGKEHIKESLETALKYLSSILYLGGTRVTTIKGSYEFTVEYSLDDERFTFYFEQGGSYLRMGITETPNEKIYLKLD